MEENNSHEGMNGKTQKQQVTVVASVDFIEEVSQAETQKVEIVEGVARVGVESAGDAGAAVTETKLDLDSDKELAEMLRQIATYFARPAAPDDLDAFSFSLKHLFNRIDFLYRHALPGLSAWAFLVQSDYERDAQSRQQIWLRLQTINRTLDRMAPVCHLLSDVIECLLDTLDNEDAWFQDLDKDQTLQMEQIKLNGEHLWQSRGYTSTEHTQLQETIDEEIWERIVTSLMDRLLIWQEQHHKLVSFQQHFTPIISDESVPCALDAAFDVLLDSAGAIFGDILPNFRSLQPTDREEISALLFDLMQQSDQMLVQFEATMEPLIKLLRHFAVISEGD